MRELIVERLVAGGLGLARTETGVVFVEGVLPGERVAVRPSGRVGGSPRMSADRVIEASPNRQDPPCPHAAACGGCDWLHIRAGAQPQLKREIFLDCLRRIGRVITPDIEVHASPPFEYRLRAQVKIDQKRQLLGFFRRSSAEIVEIGHCPLLVPQINALLANRDKVLRGIGPAAPQVRVVAGDHGPLASFPAIADLTSKETEITVGDSRFVVGGDSFFQGNRHLLHALGSWATPSMNGEECLDLFGGVGFFAVLLAHRFRRGMVVDSVPGQVAFASRNLAANGIRGFQSVCMPAQRYCLQHVKSGRTPDCMVIDPPRAGLDRILRERIGAVKPRTILSISCDPSTHARDIGFFVNSAGYRVERAALFDLYPQTHHVETAVVLKYVQN